MLTSARPSAPFNRRTPGESSCAEGAETSGPRSAASVHRVRGKIRCRIILHARVCQRKSVASPQCPNLPLNDNLSHRTGEDSPLGRLAELYKGADFECWRRHRRRFLKTLPHTVLRIIGDPSGSPDLYLSPMLMHSRAFKCSKRNSVFDLRGSEAKGQPL